MEERLTQNVFFVFKGLSFCVFCGLIKSHWTNDLARLDGVCGSFLVMQAADCGSSHHLGDVSV